MVVIIVSISQRSSFALSSANGKLYKMYSGDNYNHEETRRLYQYLTNAYLFKPLFFETYSINSTNSPGYAEPYLTLPKFTSSRKPI